MVRRIEILAIPAVRHMEAGLEATLAASVREPVAIVTRGTSSVAQAGELGCALLELALRSFAVLVALDTTRHVASEHAEARWVRLDSGLVVAALLVVCEKAAVGHLFECLGLWVLEEQSWNPVVGLVGGDLAGRAGRVTGVLECVIHRESLS